MFVFPIIFWNLKLKCLKNPIERNLQKFLEKLYRKFTTDISGGQNLWLNFLENYTVSNKD